MAAAFLVTGATGVQGGAAARELLNAGVEVRVLVRDASKPAAKELEALGAVLVVGDFDDTEAIRKATDGVKGIFLNPFPDYQDRESERKQVQRFVDAALATGTVDTLVVSSLTWVAWYDEWIAKDPDFPLKDFIYSKTAAEAAIKNAGVKYWTILRPPWLLQNYFLPMSSLHFPELPTTGEALSIIDPDLPFHQLAGSDIGRFAAAALLKPERFHEQEINMSVGAISIADAFREIEAVVGVKIPVKFVDAGALSAGQHSVFGPLRIIAGQGMNKIGTAPNDRFQLQHTFGIKLTEVREYFEQHRAEIEATLPSKN